MVQTRLQNTKVIGVNKFENNILIISPSYFLLYT